MVRPKTEMRKIEKLAARQVCFSKRRRGLFKKAQELSTLCDADIALIVFSATGKLFQYSPSSINQVLERRGLLQSKSVAEPQETSAEMQTAHRRCAILRKELAEKTSVLRQLKGEDLQGLDLKDLNKLEAILESGLTAVVKTKGERMLKEISDLKTKEAQLAEENARLKQQLVIMDTCVGEMRVQDHWDDHHSLELTISSLSSRDALHNHNFSSLDTLLKLGLPTIK
ncbi:hypothetical protein QVD17_10643 [Tagetes erecta]|uniref:Uncharacterized protein n=1 Tax=Tagetes erecta TaxID=13708 RepID=A0AAD8P4Z2_TARER|nr:hypothetical protein QVD17_10643 [Tagetes erecta]